MKDAGDAHFRQSPSSLCRELAQGDKPSDVVTKLTCAEGYHVPDLASLRLVQKICSGNDFCWCEELALGGIGGKGVGVRWVKL